MRQLQLAKDLEMPVMIHIPHTDKRHGTEQTIALAREVGNDPITVILDHNSENTLFSVDPTTFQR